MPDSNYWDACLFIELLQRKDIERFDACDELRIKASKEELIIVTSALTITEVNKLPGTSLLPEEQSKQILQFFENKYISIRSVDRHTAEYAHELTRTHGLHNMDALHVATAIIAKVTVFLTYDNVKQRRKGLLRHNLKIGTPPLKIEVPPKSTPGPLFNRPSKTDRPSDSSPDKPSEGGTDSDAPPDDGALPE